MNASSGYIRNTIYSLLLWVVLIIIVMVMTKITISQGIPVGFAIACAPLIALYLIMIFKNPYWGLIGLFFMNYFLIAIMRYANIQGLSIFIDILIALTFLSTIIKNVVHKGDGNHGIKNGLVIAALIWALYCCIELVNPSAMGEAWVRSRGITYHLLAMVTLTFLLMKQHKDIKIMLYILSAFTLIGVAKGIIQQVWGFDAAEYLFLQNGGAKTHMLNSGTRYFSLYVSAALFGAVMGHAAVLFGIASIYIKGTGTKLYFGAVALAALYGMIISGTRGSLIIPAAGLMLFVILSKKISIIIPTMVFMVTVYIFLAFTTIGQSNSYIRRMRTIFDSDEPSLVIRKQNQQLFREYLKDKPFGEGLGLSGVDAQELSSRYTTSIPTDSWYVKIWVETGIVGLVIHLTIFVYFFIYGSYLIFFKIRDQELKGLLTALICGVFGIMVSSYGNQILGQFPMFLIICMSMAFVFMGTYYDGQIAAENDSTVKNLKS